MDELQWYRKQIMDLINKIKDIDMLILIYHIIKSLSDKA